MVKNLIIMKEKVIIETILEEDIKEEITTIEDVIKEAILEEEEEDLDKISKIIKKKKSN